MTIRYVVALALLVAIPGTALAHEHAKVGDGKYELTVGWRHEPAYVGEPNGLDLKVVRLAAESEEDDHHGEAEEGAHGHEEPEVVENAHETLVVAYEYAGKSFSPPNFRPSHGRPGWYTADITPTRAGQYTIHITGNIEGVEIDVRVDPHEVSDLDDTSFPEVDPPYHETVERVEKSEERLTAVEQAVAKLDADAKASIADPPEATPATPKGTPAPGLGLVAALAAAVALAVRRR